MNARDHAIDVLLATQAITDVVHRYCRGVDRLDRELVRSCYWPEATDEHGSFSGTRDEYLAWLFDRMLPRFEFTMHRVTNVLVDRVDLDAGTAKCESYGVARHHQPSEKIEANLTTGFRYVDDFERRDGQWRIARRICPVEWVQINQPDSWFEAGPRHRRGRRDETDPVYWTRDQYIPWQP